MVTTTSINQVQSTRLPAVIGSECWLLTQDASLDGALRELLRDLFGSQLFTVNTEDEQWEKRETLETLFVDLETTRGPEAERWLSRLGTQGPRPSLIVTISHSERVPQWTGAEGLVHHGHLSLPLDRDVVNYLFREQIPLNLAGRSPLGKEPFSVEFNKFRYMTYSPELYQTLTNLRAVAKHDVTILLVGETGTGKTTLARLVHELSPRADRAMLTVACGALPGELIESELFGHVKGAFTGADRAKVGKFEAVGRGTLLLDEIDVLGPHQQAKLLRVIESGEFEPVGSNETRICQAQLIVATNVNLTQLMERNEFRSDLYYRLSVLEFDIPPLRDRPQDIIPLTLSFIREFSQGHGIAIERIKPEFLACVAGYTWPGNVRELKNHIRRAVLFSQAGELNRFDLAAAVQSCRPEIAFHREPATLTEKMATSELEILEAALRANNFRRTATAEALGISRVGLYKKMRKYGLLDRRRSSPLHTEEEAHENEL